LLVGREDLEGEIRDDKLKDGKENVRIADCEKFLFNYINHCAVSVYFANLIMDRAAIEITNKY
jgi:hypothetical protein